MRCPDCKHKQRYRDGMRCGKCSYQFILRKKSDDISDYVVRQIIKRLSDNGTYAFTATQLTLAICRYWRRKTLGQLFGSLFMIAVVAAILGFFIGSWGIALFVSVFFVVLIFWRDQRKKTLLPLGKARKIISRYSQSHPIAELADGRAFLGQTVTKESQDFPYAPERIVLVERDNLVDFLVRNRFHLNHKAAVVSRSGYPQRVLEACRSFLQQYPNTPVQVLHDASLQSFNLSAQLAVDANWSLAGQRPVDLGLSREAIQNAGRLPWLPAKEQANGMLSANHSKMLNAGYRVPVDFVGPKPFLSLVGAAVIGGAILLPTATDASAEFGVEVGDDFG